MLALHSQRTLVDKAERQTPTTRLQRLFSQFL